MSTSKLPAASKYWLPQRPRAVLEADESAGEVLRLGEFATIPTLSISEARLVMDAVFEKRATEGIRWQDTEITQKMRAYCDLFGRIKEHSHVVEVDILFQAYPQISWFEKSQLMSLLPGDVEEAKSLIPSLQGKVSDDELGQLIGDMIAITNKK